MRAALSGVLLAVCAIACVLPLGQLLGALHVPVFNVTARVALMILAPAVLSVFVPVAVAVRQHLVGGRTLPWLMLAACGPIVITAIVGALVLPVTRCIGCVTIN